MRVPHVKAVLFDLGETLYTYADIPLDWTSRYGAALARGFAAAGLTVADRDLELARSRLAGFNTRRVPREIEFGSDRIFAAALRGLDLSPCEVEAVAAGFFTDFRQSLRPYPETVAVLEGLRRHGLRTGALTDVPYGMPARFVRADLRECGVLDLLDACLTSVQAGYRKPHPAGFLKLCAALAVAPGEAIYVGNEEKDVLGARNAGIAAVLVARDGVARAWGQSATVGDLSGCFDVLGIEPRAVETTD